MKILVTGAAGFLGSKVFNNLAKEGYNVYGIDNLRRGKLSNLETKKNFFKIDLENHKKVKNFLKNPVILDLRNIFSKNDMNKINIRYHGIGHKS